MGSGGHGPEEAGMVLRLCRGGCGTGRRVAFGLEEEEVKENPSFQLHLNRKW